MRTWRTSKSSLEEVVLLGSHHHNLLIPHRHPDTTAADTEGHAPDLVLDHVHAHDLHDIGDVDIVIGKCLLQGAVARQGYAESVWSKLSTGYILYIN